MLRRLAFFAGAGYGLFVASIFVAGCSRPTSSVAERRRGEVRGGARSADCRSCHAAIYQQWADSHHAHAHRSIDSEEDRGAFQPAREFAVADTRYQLSWKNSRPHWVETHPPQKPLEYSAEYVLGYLPLRQYIVPVGQGRYQAAELAYDPAKKEWFDVFGSEDRRPGEWGHWTGRGMNWNSMCAQCHLTDFHKNYDAGTDDYASTWREQGVGCFQCHGDLPANHGRAAPPTPAAAVLARSKAQETCLPCHARNERLTGDLRPGETYADHNRLTLPTDPAVFYPDGQMRDEDFNATSFLTSRMGGKAGVTCLDCHDPHTGKTLLPAENNQLCLQCHAGSGRLNAPAIDPVAHSHHGAASAGSRCVSCHMPTTVFMQRDPRHDHGFLRPDPLLTKELGIPNACNRCHADRPVDWAIAATAQWYGPKMDSRQRLRTRAVAAIQADPAQASAILGLLPSEEVPAWRATLLLLLRDSGKDPAVLAAASRALQDADPLVRSAAVQVLGAQPGTASQLTPGLKDSSRLVRLDTEWALSAQLADGSAARQELDEYLRLGTDQPAGLLRVAEDLFNRGQVAAAEAPLRRAAAWDANSPGIHSALAGVLQALNRGPEAAAEFWRQAQLEPSDAEAAFRAGLAFAAAGQLPETATALREALRRNPRLDRAWYNLGLLLEQGGQSAEALTALGSAERLAPRIADYPYAAATIHWHLGDRRAAAAAARRALASDPNYAPALDLLHEAER